MYINTMLNLITNTIVSPIVLGISATIILVVGGLLQAAIEGKAGNGRDKLDNVSEAFKPYI